MRDAAGLLTPVPRAPSPFRLRTIPAVPPAPPATESGLATWAALAVFALLIAVHATGMSGDLTYSVATVGGVGCAVVGLRRHHVALRWPWWTLMVTAGLWTIASALRDSTGSTGDLSESRSLLPDLFAVPGYALFGLALTGVLRVLGNPLFWLGILVVVTLVHLARRDRGERPGHDAAMTTDGTPATP